MVENESKEEIARNLAEFSKPLEDIGKIPPRTILYKIDPVSYISKAQEIGARNLERPVDKSKYLLVSDPGKSLTYNFSFAKEFPEIDFRVVAPEDIDKLKPSTRTVFVGFKFGTSRFFQSVPDDLVIKAQEAFHDKTIILVAFSTGTVEQTEDVSEFTIVRNTIKKFDVIFLRPTKEGKFEYPNKKDQEIAGPPLEKFKKLIRKSG
jgi:hypothetical protein